MTQAQINAAIERIRATERRDDVLNPRPVKAKWKATPPFKAKPNPHASRGHADFHPKDAKSKDLIACAKCLQYKPLGGWPEPCPNGDSRQFMGG